MLERPQQVTLASLRRNGAGLQRATPQCGMAPTSGFLIILLALAALMALAYRGPSPVLIAPVRAVAAVAGSGQGTLLGSYTQVFMRACGEFIISYFPLSLQGAIFGKLIEVTGSAVVLAAAILRGLGAECALLVLVLACASMTYGGVSLFVVAFAVWPIAAGLFRAATLPRRLIPATILLGTFAFTMTALPARPRSRRRSMSFFGTTPIPRRGWASSLPRSCSPSAGAGWSSAPPA